MCIRDRFWGHQPAQDGQLTKSCLSQWWIEDFYTMADAYLCMEQYMIDVYKRQPVDAALLVDHLARDKDHFYQNDEIMEETLWLEQLCKMTQEP